MEQMVDTDADVVRRTARGDRAALAEAFDRYAPTVTRYVWALADSRQDAEEIVQDTFLTFWQKADGLELPEASLLPWLLVVAKNHAYNLNRKRARRPEGELPDEAPAPSGDDQAEAREKLRWVRDEIAALSPVDQKVCELCLIEGRPYAEAALMLGLTVTAVTQRVSRTRTRLKKAVSDREH